MFCKKYRLKIKALMGHFDRLVEENIETAIEVTSNLKQALGSGYADIVLALIPGTADDLLRARILQALDKTLDALSIINNCKGCGSIEEKLICFAKEIDGKAPELRDALLAKIASLLAGQLDGNRLKQSLYDLYTQAKYTAGK